MTPPRDAPLDATSPATDPAPYPAPYEEPWGRLGENLRAVAASTGLKLRELWRRNREGDLSVPGFWPVSLASLFWPLLLALSLALVFGLILRLAPGQQPPSASHLQQPVQQPVQQHVQEPVQQAGQQRVVHSLQPPNQPSFPPSFPPQLPPKPLLELDPLLALLAEDDPQACIASARPDPQARRLDLEMAGAYQVLLPERRQQLADHWLHRSHELGYDQLRLLDGSGTVLGQAARVGSGMVLLELSPEPQA